MLLFSPQKFSMSDLFSWRSWFQSPILIPDVPSTTCGHWEEQHQQCSPGRVLCRGSQDPVCKYKLLIFHDFLGLLIWLLRIIITHPSTPRIPLHYLAWACQPAISTSSLRLSRMSLQFAELWHYKANAKDTLRCLVAWWNRYHNMPIDQEDKNVTPKGYCGYCDIADKMGRRPNPCESRVCRAQWKEHRKEYWPKHIVHVCLHLLRFLQGGINLCSVSEHPPWLWTAQLNPILGRPLLDPAQGVG